MSDTDTLGARIEAFTRLPLQRQIGLLVTVGLLVAVIVTVLLWAVRPTYVNLLSGLEGRDAARAVEVLSSEGVQHRLDPASGALQVPSTSLHEARLLLATEGVPRESGTGFELLDESTGITTSRMMENARYHRALEGELARSISSLSSVEHARVHLALPRQSVFLREQSQPSASVVLRVHPGRRLDDAQVAGMVHLIASSVPELVAERVSVVDQRGHLLSDRPDGSSAGLSDRHLEYQDRVEKGYVQRIMDILVPVLGADAVRAQVVADVDFTRVERTEESWDPDRRVLRSEQVQEDENTAPGPQGVPGALSNQPPQDGEAVIGDQLAEGGAEAAVNLRTSLRATRNFEIDRTVSHVQQAPASVRRLSVAVVVDHEQVTGADGVTERVPLDDQKMAHINALVRDAVGFDAERGDSVNVINTSFRAEEQAAEIPPTPIWEEPWAQELVRHVLAGLLILILVFGALRPAIRSLARAPLALQAAGAGNMALPAGAGAAQQASVASLGAPAAAGIDAGADGNGQARVGEDSYRDGLDTAQKMVSEDPRRVAQVVNGWIRSDDSGNG